jgi:hypothetical protein
MAFGIKVMAGVKVPDKGLVRVCTKRYQIRKQYVNGLMAEAL